MEEYTNLSDGQDMFLDEPEETENTTPEEPAANEETKPEPETQTEPKSDAKPETIRIKYNGKEQDITLEQAVELAQKGMNYDHVYGELQQLRQAPEFALLDRYAAQNGMNRQQYMQALAQAETDRRVQQEMEKGIPEETARRLVNLEQELLCW